MKVKVKWQENTWESPAVFFLLPSIAFYDFEGLKICFNWLLLEVTLKLKNRK